MAGENRISQRWSIGGPGGLVDDPPQDGSVPATGQAGRRLGGSSAVLEGLREPALRRPITPEADERSPATWRGSLSGFISLFHRSASPNPEPISRASRAAAARWQAQREMTARQQAASNALAQLTVGDTAGGAVAEQVQQLEERGSIRTRTEAAKTLQKLASPIVTLHDYDALFGGLDESHENGGMDLETYRLYTETLMTMRPHLFPLGRTCHEAIMAGENVRAIARRFGRTGTEDVMELELSSVRCRAGLAVMFGESVEVTALQFGITTQLCLERLQSIADMSADD